MFSFLSGFRTARSICNDLTSPIGSTDQPENERTIFEHVQKAVFTMEILQLTSKVKLRRLIRRHSDPAGKMTARIRSKASREKALAVAPATLDIEFESPPLVFYGSPRRSTGAILSGQLELSVLDVDTVIESLEMVLLGKVTTKKPIVRSCAACRAKTTEIHKWIFLSRPVMFKKSGRNFFPFTHLLSGHLPTTANSSLGTVEYELYAHAQTVDNRSIDFRRNISVQRALQSDYDRIRTRVFPPTNILGTVTYPANIHPIGEFLFQIRLAGIGNNHKENFQRWRVRKISWRIGEHVSAIAHACSKHEHKLFCANEPPVMDEDGEEMGKGILYSSSRQIGCGDVIRGWKTNYSASEIEVEFPAALNSSSHPICDVNSPAGFEVWHSLLLEIVIFEEKFAKDSKTAASTGKSHMLTATFKVVVTERRMGVSWDQEQLPLYEVGDGGPPKYLTRPEVQGVASSPHVY